MGYSEADLEIIRRKRPDLKIQRPENFSLDQIIVEFLKKYEVFVKPVTSKSRRIGQDALSGAITGAFGADVGGDAFQISGQNKQTQVQEWTQWKQWALDHKDFGAFRNEMNSKIDEENKKITDYLESAEFKKVADEILAENKKMEEYSKKQDERMGQLFGGVVILVFGLCLGSWWINNREEKDLKITPVTGAITYMPDFFDEEQIKVFLTKAYGRKITNKDIEKYKKAECFGIEMNIQTKLNANIQRPTKGIDERMLEYCKIDNAKIEYLKKQNEEIKKIKSFPARWD